MKEVNELRKMLESKRKRSHDYTKCRTDLIKNYTNILDVLIEESVENHKYEMLEAIKNIEIEISKLKFYLENF